MSDARALLVGRGIVLGEGAYAQRADPATPVLEEWLRGRLAWLTGGNAKRDGGLVRAVNALEGEISALCDADLRLAMRAVSAQMRRAGFTDALIARAFAIVRVASQRALGMRHHDVQLLAGHALLRGQIAEMATGEGKTLAATLGICTAAMTGAAVHVVTVNDYLAERDAQANAPLFDFLGLTLGVVKQGMSLQDRRAQYAKNIVYVSNKELTFDYLKDRIALGATIESQRKLRQLSRGLGPTDTLLRGLHVAIVDEADSVLIDEARTPLIISETLPDDVGEEIYQQAIALASQLAAGRHYMRGPHRDIWLTQAGELVVADLAKDWGGVWQSALWQKELIGKALSALHLFHPDQHYIVVDKQVQIVDEFTGRVMPDRTWERGLHQMIEAKEHCQITGQRRTLSQITYQRFFGRYLLLAGMTGTAKEVASELKRVYDLSVTHIPTHEPTRRRRLPDQLYRTSEARWHAVAARAQALADQGRAVLVGTRSVEASELLSQLLTTRGVVHTVLNARQDRQEADALAQAGTAGRITVATNMAGRGTDIKLSAAVQARGGLHVILTEFHESARVDRQLFGRAARQGNPGSVEAIVSSSDELFRRYAPYLMRLGLPFLPGAAKPHALLLKALVRYAQTKAERQNRRVRLDTIGRDRQWLRALGFVGAERK